MDTGRSKITSNNPDETIIPKDLGAGEGFGGSLFEQRRRTARKVS